MKRKIFMAVLILLLVGFGYYFYDQNNKKEPVAVPEQNTLGQQNEDRSVVQEENPQALPEQAAQESAPTSTPSPAPVKESQGSYSSGEEGEMGSDIQVVEVVYDGTSFSPPTLNIKVGDYVFFKNDSGSGFWPASAPHPTHTNYPDFDAKKTVAAGGTFKFEFAKAGRWNYHDHLNPSATGVINVTAR